MTPPPLPVDMTAMDGDPFDLSTGAKIVAPLSFIKRPSRFAAPAIALLLIGAVTYVWFAPASTGPSSSQLSTLTQQSFGNAPSSGTGGSSGGDLRVYVVGAVKHPGVYELPPGARVYQLIAAAGGALPDANLVALNIAATLTDGQEVYVISNGEIPPTYLGGVPGPGAGGGASGTATASGQLININMASVDELRNTLHVSSTTAQNIVNYRTQHGPFTSVDQLLQVVSKSIYDKIKNEVTV
jgi:competence protein ComEA